MGIDQNFLNAKWDSSLGSDASYIAQLDKTFSLPDVAQKTILGLLEDMRKNKINVKNAGLVFAGGDFKRMGLTAFYKNDGYLNDGSYYYGSIMKDPLSPDLPDHNFKDTRDRISKGDRLFEYGQDINPFALDELGRFLEECEKNGIHVIGFIPPYAQAIYDELKSRPREYAYLAKIFPALFELFNRHGFLVMDFSDMQSFGAHPDEVIDGIHASEKAYLRILLKLMTKDNSLENYVRDVSYLEKRLMDADNPFMVFSIDEIN
ncbi:MAG: hypothetical protein WC732_05015 [Candidatus Omnitrophota bacterium]